MHAASNTSAAVAASSSFSCAAEHVCSAALQHADAARARWIERKLSTMPGTNQPLPPSWRPRRLPLCLNRTLPLRHEFSEASAGNKVPPVEQLIYVSFYDDTANPGIAAMEAVARLGNGTRVRFLALLATVTQRETAWAQRTGFQIVRVNLPSVSPLARCLFRGLARTASRTARWNKGVLLRVMLFAFLPSHVRVVVSIDSDLVPLRPFDKLLDENLPRMRRRGAFLGLVAEQSRFYSQSKEMPPGMPGFNGGVQLHDVAAMRVVGTYAAALDAFQAGLLFPRIGMQPEQNVFNGLFSLFPHFVDDLGCAWNRQLGSWTMKHFTARPSRPRTREDLELDAQVHACPAGCAVLHANAFKCAAPSLREAGGSCSAWSALLARLERGDNATCPDRRTYKKLNTQWVLDERIQHRNKWTRQNQVQQGQALARGFRRWFGNCCRS